MTPLIYSQFGWSTLTFNDYHSLIVVASHEGIHVKLFLVSTLILLCWRRAKTWRRDIGDPSRASEGELRRGGHPRIRPGAGPSCLRSPEQLLGDDPSP